MIIQAAGRLGKPTETITKLVREQKLGGVLMLGGNKEELKKLGNNLNTIVDQTKGIPLLYSADAEPSLINRKITGVQKVKNTSDIAGMEECREVARLSAVNYWIWALNRILPQSVTSLRPIRPLPTAALAIAAIPSYG
jgi:beta-N-acetylhexosaminidase